jgi:hypothetical protein
MQPNASSHGAATQSGEWLIPYAIRMIKPEEIDFYAFAGFNLHWRN